jgi:hypothetical protein
VKKKAKKRNTAIENEGVRDSRMNRKEQKKEKSGLLFGNAEKRPLPRLAKRATENAGVRNGEMEYEVNTQIHGKN